MQLKYRRLIVILFFCAFFISAPLVLFYATGYRFNFKKQKIESIGALFIDSAPREAQVLLNGKEIGTSLPAKILSLPPNIYDIKITKENYFPWQKKLEVSSNLTTFADKVVLFKQSQPSLLIPGQINLFLVSPDNSKLLYSLKNNSWEEIWVLNLDNLSTTLLYRTSLNKQLLQNKNISWNNTSQKILVYNDKDYFILDAQNNAPILFINSLTSLNLTNIKWDNRNALLLYGQKNRDIYKINLSNLNIDKLLTLPLLNEQYADDFLVKNGEIYYFNSNDSNLRLEKIKIAQDQIPVYLFELTKSPYRLENLNEKYLYLTNNQGSVYLIKNEGDTTTYQILDSKKIALDSGGQKIFSFNEFELWSFEEDGFGNFTQKYLITRNSQGINDAVWHANSEYLLYLTSQGLNAIELDGRDHRNNYLLTEQDQITAFATDKKSKFVFFANGNKDAQGIFLQEINSQTKLLPGLGI